MVTPPVFRISVYDKDREFRCQIGNPSGFVTTPRHNLISTTDLTLPIGHKYLPELLADGARLVIDHKGKQLSSGPIIDVKGAGPSSTGMLTFSMEDDLRILWEILGWQNPEGTLAQQNVRNELTVNGDAETIIKDLVQRNGVNRPGFPGLVVAPNLHRGTVIAGGVTTRMQYLGDVLFPAIDQAGIGVTVQQVGTDLVLDVYEPTLYPRTLSERGRTLKNWSWSRTRPTASRTIIGGPGDGAERVYRQVIDAAREAQFGMCAETFTDSGSAETAAGMDAAGNEALVAAKQANGLSLELAEAGAFKYGTGGVSVGDRVPVDIGAGVIITDVLREAKMTMITTNYAAVEPVVGEHTDDPDRATAKAINALAKTSRNQKASR